MDPRNRPRYGNAHDLWLMVQKHPGEQFWVHESDGPTPLTFGLGDEPLEPGEHYVTSLEELVGVESFDELGDKLAAALELQPVSNTIVIRSQRRRWWWRLLPGRRCRNCGARLYRTDPDGYPSRVWWCREHGPWERP
jgi:hypothetical protein